MKLITLLHFYQPHNQQEDILMRIVNESYLPLTRGFLANPNMRAVFNFTGSLTELLLDKGYDEVIDNVKVLAGRGQIELTTSAKYHAFLPLLPESESIRQIELNNEINSDVFKEGFKPKGFFSPELAIAENLAGLSAKLGYDWIAVPELSFPNGKPKRDTLYKDSDSGVFLIHRHKRVSSLILSSMCRTSADLIKETSDIHNDKFWFVVTDAETFGHHRIGHEKFLFDVLTNDFFETATVSDILPGGPKNENMPIEKITIRPSTWTNEEQDFWMDKAKTQSTSVNSFILWKDPTNKIHKLQWELVNLVLGELEKHNQVGTNKKKLINYQPARSLMDKAESSDQFWWASARPWWSLEMIEQGAFELKSVIELLEPESEAMNKCDDLYRKILQTAFEWQRTGAIRKMYLKDSATFMKPSFKNRTNPEWYNQVILEFEDEMKKAAAARDFEKAVKWRDAIEKLKLGIDIYDVLHVVDELWAARTIPSVKPFFEHKWSELSDFAKDNFMDASSEDDFEKWKANKSKPRV